MLTWNNVATHLSIKFILIKKKKKKKAAQIIL